jgi:peptidoglycan hydrolase CwlO-like protein
MKKRIGNTIIVSLLICGLTVTPVLASPSLDELKQNKAAVQSEVDSLQAQLNELMTKMNDLESQLIEKGQEKIQAEDDLVVAEEKEQQQYEDMKLRIKYMYEEGDNSALDRLMTSGSIAEVLSQAEYVEKVHTYDRNMLDEYAETVEQVKTLKATIEEDLEKIESLEAEYESQSAELNEVITEKSSEIDNLDDMIQEAAKAALAAAEAKKAEEAKKTATQQAAANTTSDNTTDSNTNTNTNTDTTTSQDDGNSSSNTGSNEDDYYEDTSSNDTSSGGTSEPEYSASTGSSVVDRAYSQLGAAYVWGACSPGAFDCSGFVSYCLTGSYSRLGTTYTFMGWTQVSDPQPGDVCVSYDHCGIYIGGGQMIHAATEGVGVIVGAVQSGMIYVRY